MTSTPATIYLKDYTPSAFLIETIDLDVAIFEDFTRVKAHLEVRRNPASSDRAAPLVLDGQDLTLESVAVDGRPVGEADYTLTAEDLALAKVPERFTLETVCRIRPQDNTTLSGFYASKDGYFTQCEAEGFRRITWFLDRPDVMARYTTTLHADKARFPMLLGNGNRVGAGEEPAQPDGAARHWAKWEDPFPKPSYLFAMVAAKLDLLEDTFVTRSGKVAKLEIYVEPGKLDQTGFAMQALKKSMKWDEDVFGLELDLDQYMIAAVGDFNMGAMENKGLNVFNTKYVLARPDTATDVDYQNIDRVVAHEYFHNWTGNRVTCRDWFQLSLKEGLTVFRDQEYGADMYSRAVQRIGEVRGLRARQFPEDAGPMSHPVRPQSYMEISNFYTATVYQKGAEVVRMIHTLIGAANFRKGMDLYFQRHDGQAVTTGDFAQAMADASGADLTQFRRWYDQAGTPTVEVSDAYDAGAKRYTLKVRQSCAPTPGQPEKAPFHIPLAVGLVGPDGRDMALRRTDEARQATGSPTTLVLSVTQPEEDFVFVEVPARPVPSLGRNFSAPVNLKYDYDLPRLTHLMAHDSDAFNRWEAGQRLATVLMLKGIDDVHAGRPIAVPEAFADAFGRVLADASRDPAFAAEALTLPSESFLGEQMDVADPDAIHAVRLRFARSLAEVNRDALLEAYRANDVPGPYSPDAASAGKRALRNLALAYLMETGTTEACNLAYAQFSTASNMTDAGAALAILADFDCRERSKALEAFYARWKDEPLVIDKWLRVQAMSRLPGTLADVKRLKDHPAFSIRNPNKVYALIGGFSLGNHVRFHAADGSGYDFLAEQVITLDALNPQVASRMARAFDRWKKFDPARQARARAALERIRATPGLSKDVAEIVTKALS
ncbi:MAG TPA: aminopeptidase N [Burkholderiales bacterium]|nr:aminopeptidase N [Burkholderiales bacterium]